jgi:hypothetical protein
MAYFMENTSGQKKLSLWWNHPKMIFYSAGLCVVNPKT